MKEQVPLSRIANCFQGVIPSSVATCDANGVPNLTLVSQVHEVDDRHVALSRQFFNKTVQNLGQNPIAAAQVYDPVTFDSYRLRLRHLRTETSGPLFEQMSVRIQAIASMTGMNGIFKLIGADVFEVLSAEKIEGFHGPHDVVEGVPMEGYRTELRGLGLIAQRIAAGTDLSGLIDGVLEALDSYFGFRQTLAFLLDEQRGRLVALASRGYVGEGVGAEVPLGEGLFGTVANMRRPLRISGLHENLRYARAIRREALQSGAKAAPEIALPGLPDAQSALAMPLIVRDKLIGVLAAESRDPLAFNEWHEGYLQIVAHQIAMGLDAIHERALKEESEEPTQPGKPGAAPPTGCKRSFIFYRNDDCVFVDGEYLIRNVPARILWKILGQWVRDGRTQFSNRELRLDQGLGLPDLRDNLESRLILLRRRLEQKCPEVRLVPAGRGRFAIEVQGPVEMAERDSA
jgi:putative methionine-R-sulfoxide reductase with GAF domain